ncbi:MAG: divalent-cation tolerance protein CutA [Planctomycetota bacterium]
MQNTKKKSSPPVRAILVTAPAKEAERLARTLVEERLAACANLLPGVTSFYWWAGKLNRDPETLIVFKTAPRRVPKLLQRLKELHSYEVPEFLALPVREANPDYALWVHAETTDRH